MRQILFLLAFSLLFAACADTQDSETIRIGIALPLTGPAGDIGSALLETFEWKIQESELDIELIIEDTQTDNKQAVTIFNKFVEDEIKIVYSTGSAAGMVLKPLAEQHKILLWNDASHPDLTTNSKYVIRQADLVSDGVTAFTDHMQSLDIKSVGLVYQQDDWGLAHNEYFQEKLAGTNITFYSEIIDHRQPDFKTELTKVISQNPDALVLVAFGPASALLPKQVAELEYEGVVYSSLGLELTPGSIETAAPYLSGTYYLSYQDNAAFTQAYTEQFEKEPSLLSLNGYSDAEFLLQAIKETQSTEPEDIIAYLKSQEILQGTYHSPPINEKGDILIMPVIKAWN